MWTCLSCFARKEKQLCNLAQLLSRLTRLRSHFSFEPHFVAWFSHRATLQVSICFLEFSWQASSRGWGSVLAPSSKARESNNIWSVSNIAFPPHANKKSKLQTPDKWVPSSLSVLLVSSKWAHAVAEPLNWQFGFTRFMRISEINDKSQNPSGSAETFHHITGETEFAGASESIVCLVDC